MSDDKKFNFEFKTKGDKKVVLSKDPFLSAESRKSLTKKKTPAASKTKTSKSDTAKNIDLLEKDAIDEILRETKRGEVRAELSGSWRPPSAKINSRLFNNTLSQVLQSNHRMGGKK